MSYLIKKMYILEKLTVGFLIKIVKCPTEKKVYIPVFFLWYLLSHMNCNVVPNLYNFEQEMLGKMFVIDKNWAPVILTLSGPFYRIKDRMPWLSSVVPIMNSRRRTNSTFTTNYKGLCPFFNKCLRFHKV